MHAWPTACAVPVPVELGVAAVFLPGGPEAPACPLALPVPSLLAPV